MVKLPNFGKFFSFLGRTGSIDGISNMLDSKCISHDHQWIKRNKISICHIIYNWTSSHGDQNTMESSLLYKDTSLVTGKKPLNQHYRQQIATTLQLIKTNISNQLKNVSRPCFIFMCKPSNSFKFDSKYKQYMFTKLHVHTHCIFSALIVNLNLCNYLRGLNIHILWSDTSWPSWYSLIISALASWVHSSKLLDLLKHKMKHLISLIHLFQNWSSMNYEPTVKQNSYHSNYSRYSSNLLYNGSCNSYVLIALLEFAIKVQTRKTS